jgi:hypothetical protein
MRQPLTRRIIYAGLIVVGLAVLSGVLFAGAPAQRANAAEFGVFEGPGCDGRARLPIFEAWAGRHVERTVDALDRRDWDHLESSAQWIAQCWRGSGVALTLSAPMVPEDGKSTLAAGASGAYDGSFRKVAQALIDNGYADATVRIGWEANGEWMAWAGARDPDTYVRDWRHIVEVMRSIPGQRFKFEWCPNIGRHAVDPDRLYPGDDVVDVIGLDVYNEIWNPALANPDVRWTYLVEEPYGLKWHRDFARRHGKPISFPEWGTGLRPDGHGGGDDPRFIRGMADWFARTGPLYQSYWDVRASDYDAQLSAGRYPLAGAAFLKAFGGPKAAGRKP